MPPARPHPIPHRRDSGGTAKLVERLVRSRLMYVIEKWHLLRPEQAGYRSCRSTEEQLSLVSQFISDGLEKGGSTLMLAVDFTAAFDRAHRTRLYRKMLDKGFPPAAVRWVKAFLTRRRARVRVADMLSGLREFRAGFPQGTVLGPVLWDLFLDDLIPLLREGFPPEAVEVVVYADDVTVLVRGPKLETIYEQAQQVLDRLSRWEVDNDARVSLAKTTATVFTPRRTPLPPAQRPRLWYADQSLDEPFRGERRLVENAAHPKLLGVVYDERLTIQAQVQQPRPKLQKRGRVVATLSGTKWGSDLRTLRAVHLAYAQAKRDYGLAAYGPFATADALSGLDTEQYHAACRISGCPQGTRREVALMKAGLASLKQRVDYCAAVQYERCRRLPADNRARLIAEQPGAEEPKKRSWRTRARQVLRSADLAGAPREPLATHARAPPWEGHGPVVFRPHLCRKVTRRDPPERRKAAALDTLAQLP
eukprot:gene17872-biopygen23133